MSRLSGRLRWQASSHRDGVNLAERGWQWRRFREQARSQSLNRVQQRETGQLSGRLRWQASSHRDGVNLAEIGWQWRRFREQARSHNSGSRTSARYESAVRPPSLASQLPQGRGESGREGWQWRRFREQARSHSLNRVRQRETGRLSGRLRWQASSHRDGVNLAEMGWQWRRLREQARSHSLNRVHQRETGRLSGRLREQAHSYKSKGKAAQPPHSTMSASSSAFDLAFDPPATSEG